MDWDTYNLQLPVTFGTLIPSLDHLTPDYFSNLSSFFLFFFKRRYNNFHKVHILCVQFNEFLKCVYPSNHHPDQHISGTVGASFGSPSWTYPANLSPLISFATFWTSDSFYTHTNTHKHLQALVTGNVLPQWMLFLASAVPFWCALDVSSALGGLKAHLKLLKVLQEWMNESYI